MVITKPAANEGKRQTITNGNNHRLSTFAGRPSNSGRPSSTSRQSVMRQSQTGRRSSGNQRNSRRPTGASQDPRPLSDKQYGKEAVRYVLQYLATHGYEEQISAKDLSPASTQTFTNVFKFLFNQIDPSFTSFSNLQEQFPELLKALGYPFPIPKRTLLAVGTPHTWPSLLATLTWMVDVLLYAEQAPISEDRSSDLLPMPSDPLLDLIFKEVGDRLFFEYIRSAYDLFLKGNNNFGELQYKYTESFRAKSAQLEEEIQHISQANEALRLAISEQEEKGRRKGELEEAKQNLESDAEELKNSLEKCDKYLLHAKERLLASVEQLESYRKELAAVQEDKRVLQQKLAEQLRNKINFGEIMEKKKTLDEKLASADVKQQQADSILHELEVNLSKCTGQMKEKIDKYNQLAVRLHLIPRKQKQDINYKIFFECHTSSLQVEEEEGVKGEKRESEGGKRVADVEGTILPALSSLKSALSSSHEKLSLQVVTAREAHADLLEAISEKKHDISHLKEKLAYLDKLLSKEKDTHRNALSAERHILSSVREQTYKMREEIEAKLENSLALREKMSHEKHNIEQQCLLETKDLQTKISNLLEAIYQHKTHIQTSLIALHNRYSQTLSSVEVLKIE